MSWYSFRPYVSVEERRANAAKKAAKLAKKGRTLSPVRIAGRQIATTFWGKAWCEHLESYSDFESRLPRGRAYAKNGSVIDLQITPGKITALIAGSSVYEATLSITPLPVARWADIKRECSGKIDSLVELLQGRLSGAVMSVITDHQKGLFPSPDEILKSCSCPDWAELCKHLAAVLYGVGARLDEKPELLFVLRGVDHLELLDEAAGAHAITIGESSLDSSDLSAIFGVDIAVEPPPPSKKPSPKAKRKPAKKKPVRKRSATFKKPAKAASGKAKRGSRKSAKS